MTGNLDRPGGAMFTLPAFDIVALTGRQGQRGHFDRRRTRVRNLPEFNGEFPVVALAEEIATPGDGQIRALITAAGNPVQDMYLREAKGENNEYRAVAVKALADPARGCKL